MAKELFSVKIEGDTKESMNELIDDYISKGIISERGDIINVAATLLERNLSVKNPLVATGIEELDQLTGRINRLFTHLYEQNQTAIDDAKFQLDRKIFEYEEKIRGLVEAKNGLEQQLVDKTQEASDLMNSLVSFQNLEQNHAAVLEEKNKYAKLLEAEIDKLEVSISGMDAIQEENNALREKDSEKDALIKSLEAQITGLRGELSKLAQTHKDELKILEFEHKKELFEREKQLQEDFNNELTLLRDQRDEFFVKQEKKVSTLQIKYDSLVGSKQKLQEDFFELEFSYKQLLESNKVGKK